MRDTLGALAERFAALRIDAGGLHLSRAARVHSRALALKRIVMYSPNWVRSQNRMASTSNQARPPAFSSHPCPVSHPIEFAAQSESGTSHPDVLGPDARMLPRHGDGLVHIVLRPVAAGRCSTPGTNSRALLLPCGLRYLPRYLHVQGASGCLGALVRRAGDPCERAVTPGPTLQPL